jgi:hypothetical protein
VLTKGQPRPVVTREQHQGVPIDAGGFERVEHLAHAPIDLLDDVTVHATGAVAGKFIRPRERNVRQRVGQIEEERRAPVVADEPNCMLGQSLRQGAMIHWPLDHLIVLH